MVKTSSLILLALYIAIVISDKNYGSFNLTVTDVVLCKGPKHKDCSIMKTQITTHNVLQYDVNVTQNIVPTKGKIVAITNGKEYLRFQMKKPCEHLFLKPILYSIFNITKDCVILKSNVQAFMCVTDAEPNKLAIIKPRTISSYVYHPFNCRTGQSPGLMTLAEGRYQYSVDVQKITQSYYGGSFLLGNWTFRSLFYSDECNFYCVDIKVHLF